MARARASDSPATAADAKLSATPVERRLVPTSRLREAENEAPSREPGTHISRRP